MFITLDTNFSSSYNYTEIDASIRAGSWQATEKTALIVIEKVV